MNALQHLFGKTPSPMDLTWSSRRALLLLLINKIGWQHHPIRQQLLSLLRLHIAAAAAAAARIISCMAAVR
jgi:hypothetical protein